MAEKRDVVIIGGGHNGLVTAFYLAKAGFKPLVLERRDKLAALPLPKSSIPAFDAQRSRTLRGRFVLTFVRDMQLEQHGLKLITPEASVVSLHPDGRALRLYRDAQKSAHEIAQFSQKGCCEVSRTAGIAAQDGQRDRRRAEADSS